MSINNEDLMLVNRLGVDYKTTAADLKQYLTTEPVPTFVTVSVGTEGANWTPYVRAENYLTKEAMSFDDDSLWYYNYDQRKPENMFTEDPLDWGKNLVSLAAGTLYVDDQPEIIFEPPGGLEVVNSVTIVAGFHLDAQLGTLAVNGVDVLNLRAYDLRPEPFTYEMSGTLNSFSIRQKFDSGRECAYAPAVGGVMLDGKLLRNQTATTLTFEPGEFFDQLKVGTKLRQVNPKVTGVVSKVIPGENKVVLDDLYPEFVTGSLVVVVGVEEPPASTRGVPFNNDRILINRGGVDYQTTAAELREYVNYVPPMPWDEHVANGGVVFHVKDATGTVTFGRGEVYNLDGTYKGEIDSFGPGEEVVILTNTFLMGFFSGNNSDVTWNFGELTDVTKAYDFDVMFMGCNSFNGTGMSDWNVSNVKIMNWMFNGCTNFNQDLSKWCVLDVDHEEFDESCTSWQEDFKPVWGTCPRGEDQ